MWNRSLIEEGQGIVLWCVQRDQPGPYQLQAAIQAVHCDADTFEDTDWSQIGVLYDHLYSIQPSPVVALNRAIAIGELEGPESALTEIDAISEVLDGYHLMHAARGTALRELDQVEAARAAFARAAALAPRDEERRFLEAQLADLSHSM